MRLAGNKRVFTEKATLIVAMERESLTALEALAKRDGLTSNAYARMLIMRHIREVNDAK